MSGDRVEQCFVTFLSPGTFCFEETTKPIASWNVEAAKAMADEIVERYNATPFAFYFSTRAREPGELDSKVINKSGRFYLGGHVLTLEDVKARNDSSDRILIDNMECNGWGRIIVNDNSWRVTAPLVADDVVLDYVAPKKLAASFPQPQEAGDGG